ncbi:hypothetical protein AB6A40_004936 [Gnathostoma spinigerum]|uniref:Elapor1-like galactose binding domain-containing protein n=1 Tax=Gnathostoma spinigerum TaxID=75299 RepID=A0ABD6ENH6_9BILA
MIRPSLMNSFPAILATLDIWLQTISFLSFVNIGDSSVCTPKDFTFEYTNCDSNGQRWRVAIPNRTPLQCEGGVPIPTIAVNCSFSCGPGMYLDIDSQQCRPCEKGTYSLGGGIRFDEFPQLPPGFSVENIDISTDSILSDAGHTLNETSCPKETGWIVKNTELIYVLSPCISKMTYSVTLVRPGYVEYSYRMPKNSRGLVFNVVVKNEQCQSYRDQLKLQLESALKSAKSRSEESGTWQTKRIELRTGPNIITWSVTNNRESSSHGEFIVISKIDVVGRYFSASKC